MNNSKILKNYVSEIDRFLNHFDETHREQSKSQKAEKLKYSRIYYLRDVADHPDEKKLPDGF